MLVMAGTPLVLEGMAILLVIRYPFFLIPWFTVRNGGSYGRHGNHIHRIAGRGAELLGIPKWNLIELYAGMGIPYLT